MVFSHLLTAPDPVLSLLMPRSTYRQYSTGVQNRLYLTEGILLILRPNLELERPRP